MRVKEIQTIISENPYEFDVAVNALLKEGYTLTRRGPEQMGPNAWKLYAELVKLDDSDMKNLEAEPVAWKEAVEVLRETCETAKDCNVDFCPMYEWCQRNLSDDGNQPYIWGSPEV